ncbi:MAG: class I SAM-dependent methyltransferase [Verrucomicrobiota bacterium]|nr:class I SAM-dependent methyltransferase [Verrucomicrobiota bacterium]
MDFIAQREQKKYTALWDSCPEYRAVSPADYLTPLFLTTFQKQIRKDDAIIDYGCGPGRSAIPLEEAGLQVHLLDLCENSLDLPIFLKTVGPHSTVHFHQACLWDLPSTLAPAEWMICFDVLEHLPEKKVLLALEGLASRMTKGGLVSISLREDHHGKLIRQRLHLTIKTALWWHEQLSRFFTIYKELYTDSQCLVWALKPFTTEKEKAAKRG